MDACPFCRIIRGEDPHAVVVYEDANTVAFSPLAPATLRKSAKLIGPFDIFLSHSFHDTELILGVRSILQRAGKRVYVDWIDDPELDRSRVTKNTAARLRERMLQCPSMIYAATKAATTSKWMPWELGYFDGRKGPEAIAIIASGGLSRRNSRPGILEPLPHRRAIPHHPSHAHRHPTGLWHHAAEIPRRPRCWARRDGMAT